MSRHRPRGRTNEPVKKGQSIRPRYITSQPGGKTTGSPSSSIDRNTVAAEKPQDIAIIGVSGRYPDAENIDELWINLLEGKDSVKSIPAERWELDNFSFTKEDKDRFTQYQGGFITDVDKFDPLFFEISPREAETIDPQERLFLQTAWSTIEDAGYTPEQLSGYNSDANIQTGVYVGVMYEEYSLFAVAQQLAGRNTAVGSTSAGIANRVSSVCNFSGPSYVLNSMCSSSLTAIQVACNDLITAQTDVALAGGVNLSLHINKYLNLDRGSFLSSRGRCSSFGNQGDGFTPSEGVGAVLLKPLSKARADDDHIYAVIKGCSINHGGKTSGFTVPNPIGQAQVIDQAFKRAGVKPEQLSYIEAHGTGTQLGDPVEISGLAKAFKQDGKETAGTQRQSCAIGSVKSNFGHAESAAGIAGLTKVLLQMKHRKLVPNLHSEKLNSNIDFDNTPFVVQQTLADWAPPNNQARIAGVSSFGAGGSNAHLIVEENTTERKVTHRDDGAIVVLSARTDAVLDEMVDRLITHLQTHSDINLHDIAYTLQVGRVELHKRIAIVVETVDELVAQLHAFKHSEHNAVIRGDSKQNNGTFSSVTEAGKAYLKTAMLHKEFESLAQLWASGAHIDWRLLYQDDLADHMPKKISLPGYAFVRQRYWLTESPVSAESLTAAVADNSVLLSAKSMTTQTSADNMRTSTQGLQDTNEADDDKHIAPPGLQLFTTAWVEQGIPPAKSVSSQEVIIIALGLSREIANDLENKHSINIIYLDEESEIELYISLQQKIQSLGLSAHNVSTQYIFLYTWDYYLLSGIVNGLMKTWVLESPSCSVKSIGIKDSSSKNTDDFKIIIDAEKICLSRYSYEDIRYCQGIRQVKKVIKPPEISLLETRTSLFCAEGVYLITGGQGGLGREVAEHIAAESGGQLILVGRREQCNIPANELNRLNATYISCDITNRKSVERLVNECVERYDRLDGVIHSAGIVSDATLLNKTTAQAKAVLAPKILGAKYLADATQDIDLAFTLYFSSLASVFGNIGQADYAAANAWLDQFATYRNQQRTMLEGSGYTLSINWPLWADGGMNVPSDVIRRMARQGLQPMPSNAGMQALAELYRKRLDQGIVLYGTGTSVLRSGIVANTPNTNNSSNLAAIAPQNQHLQDRLAAKVSKQVLALLGGVLKISAADLATNEPLGSYGADSVMMSSLAAQLNGVYNIDIAPTVFYNHPTVDELTSHLLKDYLVQVHHTHREDTADAVTPDTILTPEPEPQARAAPKLLASMHNAAPGLTDDSIAIIGMSGRFPGSPDVDTFWQNLKANRDLITEVPAERWVWQDYYGDPDDPANAGQNKTRLKWGGFINDADKFDPLHFNISPKEAVYMDPQHRIALETVYHALEDAGIAPGSLASTNTGIFIGSYFNDYANLMSSLGHDAEAHSATGLAQSMVTNRISYLLGTHGPSETIDTACSSSLIAVHRGISQLRDEHCDLIIAGGVCLNLIPDPLFMLSKAGMLSSDGRCKTFDSDANGYVRGEGVGMVVLKRLSQAKTDGDAIYATIRSTAENHGGRANTLTSPNPQAQTALLLKAYRQADIDPRQLGYIEAHGTGTPLGDPIEVEGLKHAFDVLYKEHDIEPEKAPHVRLGSVKANIGHLEPAAGIASLIKVVLSLTHKKIPGNPQLKTANNYLKLDNSVFQLQKNTTDWEPVGNELRMAGVSSFGFGGVNAHAVIQEYPQTIEKTISHEPVIVVLSAKTSTLLQQQIKNIHSYVVCNEEASVCDIAYTLQVGRDAMEYRLAIVVKTLEGLRDGLKAYLEGRTDQVLLGNTKSREAGFLLEGEAGQAYIDTAIQKREFKSLAQLWVKGTEIDWHILYKQGVRPNKVRIPGYAFSRERYWLKTGNTDRAPAATAQLHPLLHSNTSTVEGPRFSASFTGNETFLTDHVVAHANGKVPTLPGVAYLEMAREAGSRYLDLSPTVSDGKRITRISDIKWLEPVTLQDRPISLHVDLFHEGDDLAYEIYSYEKDQGVIHAQGLLSCVQLTQPTQVDIAKLKTRLTAQIAANKCYEQFSSLGLDYGISFQNIEQLYFNENEALSTLKSPESTGFTLPPTVLDIGLQTLLGLQLGNINNALHIPFCTEAVSVYADPHDAAYCYVKFLSATAKKQSEHRPEPVQHIAHYQIDFLSAEGVIVLSFTDFVALPIKNTTTIRRSIDKKTDVGLSLNTFDWIARPPNDFGDIHRQIILLVGAPADVSALLKNTTPTVEVVDFGAAGEKDIYNAVQSVVQEYIRTTEPAQLCLVYRDSDFLQYGFLSGLLKTASLENPLLKTKTIGVDHFSQEAVPAIQTILSHERNDDAPQVRYCDGQREIVTLIATAKKHSSKKSVSFKSDGIYLITGGAGGLGQLVARHLARNSAVRIILCGRSKTCPLEKSLLDSLNAEYISCDISVKSEVEQLIKAVIAKHQRLNGILHAAGVTQDSLLMNKVPSQTANVFAPKITGAKNLHAVAGKLEMDFMLFFSSAAGVVGNIGQADYASANSWLDNYAAHLNELALNDTRACHTCSINWPLWADGGLNVASDVEENMESLGMKVLPTEQGLKALEEVLRLGHAQVLVSYGSSLPETDNRLPTPTKFSPPKTVVAKGPEALKPLATDFFIDLFSSLVEIPRERISLDETFEAYGVDSILTVSLTNRLKQHFGDLPVTLLFEYPTLGNLIDYFVEVHTDSIASLVDVGPVSNDKEATPWLVESVAPLSHSRSDHRRNRATMRGAETRHLPNATQDDIAIIGLSGRYPGANSVDEFWDNLKNGVDSVSVIPDERWSLENFFDQGRYKPGKSYSKWGGFIDDIDKFDPLFFGISPREANVMSPQERMFLQTAWHLLEDAAYTPRSLSDKKLRNIGVYVGVMYEEYQLYGAEESSKGNPVALSGSQGSIANRVSYLLNLKGPSLAVDTMCSSSLTAIHLACKDLLNNETSVAIAGGVNVNVHPNKYKLLSQGQFASDKGRCESFGEGGEGYVPAEGVGAVLLKRLSQAETDGDRIYATVKGSSVNHGGKTSGYTVPNPNAQAAAIEVALNNSKVTADQVSYVEAHGTGTSLGDPIEIAGLSKAFKTAGKPNKKCSIGSVKSNIGHAESAAGISGLTKVLLQMEHRKLVPSLHSSILNPHIDFESSPFSVQQTLADWTVDNQSKRIAGISSFGAGGSNAHLIVEEYSKQQPEFVGSGQALIVLSAKNKETLHEYALKVLGYLQNNRHINMYDLAYTFQVGREPMDIRLALVISSVDELCQTLEAFQSGIIEESCTSDLTYVAPILNSKDDDRALSIQRDVVDGNLGLVSQHWLAGHEIEWQALYLAASNTTTLPNRIRLPVYPFLKKRCWFQIAADSAVHTLSTSGSVAALLHPLVHRNTSSKYGARFSSEFDGREAFFKDHHINGIATLPGVAILELARAAGCEYLKDSVTRITDITWVSPIQLDKLPKQVHITFIEDKSGANYEIVSNKEAGREIHCTGRLSVTDKYQSDLDKISIERIRQRLHKSIQGGECYRLFAEKGLLYGESFQRIEQLFYSSDGNEVLSQLSAIPAGEYVLPPGLLDCALQSVMGLSLDTGESHLRLPFSVKSVEIRSDLTHARWCHVTRQKSEHKNISATSNTGSHSNVYDRCQIDLLSESGELLLRFHDYVALVVNDEDAHERQAKPASNSPETASGEMIYLKPSWEPVTLIESEVTPQLQALIIGEDCDFTRALRSTLKAQGYLAVTVQQAVTKIDAEINSVFFLHGLKMIDPSDIKRSIAVKERLLFNLAKLIQQRAPKALFFTALLHNTQSIGPLDVVEPSGSGIIGLTGAMGKEIPHLSVRTIDIPELSQDTINQALRIPFSREQTLFVLRDHSAYRPTLIPLESIHPAPDQRRKPGLQQDGVYVILGGAGGLGISTTAHLIKKYNATVYWLGRREENDEIRQQQETLAISGNRPIYIRCDAMDTNSIERAYRVIKQREKKINGLFHSALVLNDKALRSMSVKDFNQVFEPKSVASHHFVNAFKNEPLDFICFYSSVQSQSMSAGQSNYAAACTYKDAYAYHVSQVTSIPTYILNWSYWGDVGVVSSEFYNQRMNKLGIGSITAQEGMQALEYILSSGFQQLAIFKSLNPKVLSGLPFISDGMVIKQQTRSSNIHIPKEFIESL